MNTGLFTSTRPDWNTPESVLAKVREFGAIGLDPCSNPTSIVGATTSWTKEDDGLSRSWSGHGLVYVNPPYGREIGAWIDKMRYEDASKSVEILALVPARTDARWFQEANPRSLCLWRGRLTFLGAPSSAPFPSAIMYYGNRTVRFRDVFRAAGLVVL